MARESLTSKALRDDPDYDEEEIIKYTATQLYAGKPAPIICSSCFLNCEELYN